MCPDVLERAARTTSGGSRRPGRRAALVSVVAVAAVVVAAVLVFVSSDRHSQEATGRVLVVTAVAGATNSDLLAVEGRLVGSGAVVDPTTGRLPDVAAFHRAGIAGARVEGGRLTVTFLANATAAQIDRARAAVLTAPTVAGLADGLDLSAVQRMLDSAVSGAAGPPGLIVTAATPRGVWAGAAGVADVKTGMRMSPALQYRVGSTTKTLTAVVVLQLVNEGRLALDAAVSTYLPGLLPYREPITVRQLLSHTTGLVDAAHFGAANVVAERDAPRVKDPGLRDQALQAMREARTNPSLTVPLRVYLAVTTTRPLAFPPGSAYTYSNTDYVVLTLLVEKITGHSLADEYAQRIFTPLGLRQTFLATSPSFPAPFARSYTQDAAGTRVDATGDLALGTTGSGDVVSTAADMTTFFRALLGGRLLPASLLTLMKTPSAESVRAGTPYGFAMQHYTTPCGVEAIGHGGAIGGYLTDVYASDNGSTVVVYVQNAVGTTELGAMRDPTAAAAFCAAEGLK